MDEITGAGVLILRREDGSEVAAFGERAAVEEVEAAWEDKRGRKGRPAPQ